MIDEYNDDHTGWARFSDDRVMRYRLARCLSPGMSMIINGDDIWATHSPDVAPMRAVFLMLNPSTADAFKLDPTVNECRKRAVALGAQILEVVNLFALRSPYPADLKKRAHGSRGDDADANREILHACSGASMVIAAWGNHGALDHRATVVRWMLREHGVTLHHLGMTQDGFPKHPLARGKHRIPGDLMPQEWRS
jgi:hypothetical protein